ncbi:MAG TPA: TadE/TadG family type IV pilus assembly protein [Acidimicrobiia bacterium]|nr:TadE/TadG family type IV pilus assembly protein [Acidimicrobiia bacterium]
MHMLKRAGASSEKERGATLVEAALVMPMLLLLTFGIWTTARAWNVSNTMEHAAREGVRFASTEFPWSGGSASDVRSVIDAQLAGSSIASAAVQTVCIDQGTSPCSFGSTAQGYNQVAVELVWPDYTLDFLFFSMNIDLSVEAVGRYEG